MSRSIDELSADDKRSNGDFPSMASVSDVSSTNKLIVEKTRSAMAGSSRSLSSIGFSGSYAYLTDGLAISVATFLTLKADVGASRSIG
ncbi:hypothetical protein [uncultured Roseobacter sp.]|uniref:hypothetical protein n=1 Tax=uncultured Roseobacter sp. TaxID=114847 RepID=UPI002633543B|nr:hypothetical protein [uncultured Roseobacter sp.]